MTPAEAIAGGADRIVVGRPILRAKDPKDAIKRTLDEIQQGLEARGK
jgi:orotidine-5'-phosphate decarboxylase